MIRSFAPGTREIPSRRKSRQRLVAHDRATCAIATVCGLLRPRATDVRQFVARGDSGYTSSSLHEHTSPTRERGKLDPGPRLRVGLVAIANMRLGTATVGSAPAIRVSCLNLRRFHPGDN